MKRVNCRVDERKQSRNMHNPHDVWIREKGNQVWKDGGSLYRPR